MPDGKLASSVRPTKMVPRQGTLTNFNSVMVIGVAAHAGHTTLHVDLRVFSAANSVLRVVTGSAWAVT